MNCTCVRATHTTNLIPGGGLFGGRKPGIPVKFSLENDLSEAECRKLLDRYTPQHMKVNKATQKLFIK